MAAHELAPDFVHIPLDPIAGVNAYLAGDVLIDSGGRQAAKTVLKALAARTVTLHALTHVHPDHQGSSHAVATALAIPFAAPVGETDQAEAGHFDGLSTGSRWAKLSARVFGGPGHPVDRAIAAGDEVGGFTAIALPGHTPGHLGFWRESDRVLIAGDAFRNLSYATGGGRPDLPPAFFTQDEVAARASAEQILALRPRILAMGHGRPLVGEAKVQAALERGLARS